MRINYILSLLLLISIFGCSSNNETKLLIFSKTAGFRHGSIETGQKAIEKLGSENGFSVTITENPEYFNEDSLKDFSTVIYLNLSHADVIYCRHFLFFCLQFVYVNIN